MTLSDAELAAMRARDERDMQRSISSYPSWIRVLRDDRHRLLAEWPQPAPVPTPVPTPDPTPAPGMLIDGFAGAAGTTGGAGRQLVLFTNLNNDGTGSLRAALSAGDRIVKPAPGLSGRVALTDVLRPAGDNVTLDLEGRVTLPRTLFLGQGNENWLVTATRWLMDSFEEDAITLKFGAKRIAIIGNSISRWTDGAIDATRQCEDVTIAWNIIADGRLGHAFAHLLGHESKRMSVHHNLYYRCEDRVPQAFWNELLGATANPTEVTVDFVANLVWDMQRKSGASAAYAGVAARDGWLNDEGNVYHSKATPASPLRIETGGRAYQRGNVRLGTAAALPVGESQRFPVPAPAVIPWSDPIAEARRILALAGARPLDAADQARIAAVVLP